MHHRLFVCLVGLLSPVYLVSCEEMIEHGGVYHVRWATGASVGALLLLPFCFFIAWCFYKVHLHRREMTGLRLIGMLRAYGFFLLAPVFPLLFAFEGFNTDFSISESQIVIGCEPHAEFGWDDLQQVVGDTSEQNYALIFGNGATSHRLEVHGATLGEMPASTVRGWVESAAKANGMKFMRF